MPAQTLSAIAQEAGVPQLSSRLRSQEPFDFTKVMRMKDFEPAKQQNPTPQVLPAAVLTPTFE